LGIISGKIGGKDNKIPAASPPATTPSVNFLSVLLYLLLPLLSVKRKEQLPYWFVMVAALYLKE
jgi:hypothetical protein